VCVCVCVVCARLPASGAHPGFSSGGLCLCLCSLLLFLAPFFFLSSLFLPSPFWLSVFFLSRSTLWRVCAVCMCVWGGGGGVDQNLRAGIDWNGVGSGNHLLVDPDSVEETTVQLGPVVKVGLRVVTVVLAPGVSGRAVCCGGGALGGEFVC